jgi:hypothetical protein
MKIDAVVQKVIESSNSEHKYILKDIVKSCLYDNETYKWLVEMLEEVHEVLLTICPASENTCRQLLRLAVAALLSKVQDRLKQKTDKIKQKYDLLKQAANAKLRALLLDKFLTISSAMKAIGHFIIVLKSLESNNADTTVVKRHLEHAARAMENVTVGKLWEELRAFGVS